MTDDSWSAEIVVPNSPQEVFTAVTEVRRWWSEAIDGETATVGDEFSFTDHVEHWCRFRITEMAPGRRVVWLVVDSRLDFVDNPTEWTGTRVIFDITPNAEGTALRFTHDGLRPTVDCYDACSRGWDFYLHQSLKGLLTVGTGQPMQ